MNSAWNTDNTENSEIHDHKMRSYDKEDRSAANHDNAAMNHDDVVTDHDNAAMDHDDAAASHGDAADEKADDDDVFNSDAEDKQDEDNVPLGADLPTMSRRDTRTAYYLWRLRQLTSLPDDDLEDNGLTMHRVRPQSQSMSRRQLKPTLTARPQTSLGHRAAYKPRKAEWEPVLWEKHLRTDDRIKEHKLRPTLDADGECAKVSSQKNQRKVSDEFSSEFNGARWTVAELERLDRLMRPTSCSQARAASVTWRRSITEPNFTSLWNKNYYFHKDLPPPKENNNFSGRFTGEKKLSTSDMKHMVNRLSSVDRQGILASRRQSADTRRKLGVFGNYYVSVKDAQPESRAQLQQRLVSVHTRAIQRLASRDPWLNASAAT